MAELNKRAWPTKKAAEVKEGYLGGYVKQLIMSLAESADIPAITTGKVGAVRERGWHSAPVFFGMESAAGSFIRLGLQKDSR